MVKKEKDALKLEQGRIQVILDDCKATQARLEAERDATRKSLKESQEAQKKLQDAHQGLKEKQESLSERLEVEERALEAEKLARSSIEEENFRIEKELNQALLTNKKLQQQLNNAQEEKIKLEEQMSTMVIAQDTMPDTDDTDRPTSAPDPAIPSCPLMILNDNTISWRLDDKDLVGHLYPDRIEWTTISNTSSSLDKIDELVPDESADVIVWEPRVNLRGDPDFQVKEEEHSDIQIATNASVKELTSHLARQRAAREVAEKEFAALQHQLSGNSDVAKLGETQLLRLKNDLLTALGGETAVKEGVATNLQALASNHQEELAITTKQLHAWETVQNDLQILRDERQQSVADFKRLESELALALSDRDTDRKMITALEEQCVKLEAENAAAMAMLGEVEPGPDTYQLPEVERWRGDSLPPPPAPPTQTSLSKGADDGRLSQVAQNAALQPLPGQPLPMPPIPPEPPS